MPAPMATAGLSKKRSSGPVVSYAAASASNANGSSNSYRMRATDEDTHIKIENFKVDQNAFYEAFESKAKNNCSAPLVCKV